DDLPMEMIVILTFEDVDGKTRLTLTQQGLPAGEFEDMTVAGWNQSLDKLAATLKEQEQQS
ncbi:hypothetical protein FBR02_14530, partial [Anaerolineae bacterium CFX9]|nr:hypothetical protein [Anaerolineae bacterium CFX9]